MDEFRCIPGYEGLYSISQSGQIRSDKFNRTKYPSDVKNGQQIIMLYKNNIPSLFTVKSLIDLVWNNTPITEKPGVAEVHSKPVRCITTDETFSSYKECCEAFHFGYKEFSKVASHNHNRFTFNCFMFEHVK